jgi:hypothetical protein
MNELSVLALRAMPDEQAALRVDSLIRGLEAQWKMSFAQRGYLMLECEERELWKHLFDSSGNPYGSFGQWICDAAPFSRADCYQALRTVKDLPDVPRHELEQIPRCNLMELRKLSTAVRAQPEVIEAAKTMPQKSFIGRLQAGFPEQHLEQTRSMTFRFTESQHAVVEQALEFALRADGGTREQVVEGWAVSSMQGGDSGEQT